MKPLTNADVDSSYNCSKEVEDGRTVARLTVKFPLEWQWKHFEQNPQCYAVKPEDLDAQDNLSYDKLAAYVKSFFMTKCVDVDNNFLLDDKGEHLFVS